MIYDRERNIWERSKSLIVAPAVFAIPPGSIVRNANYVVSSDAAYLWRGIKTGGPRGGRDIPCNRMSAPSRAFTRNFYFPCEKKTRRQTGVEETGEGKKNARERRRVGCLEIGVGKKGGGRKRHDKNNGLEQEEKEDGITRGTIVGRKIVNNRRRGGWKRGEIRSEREDLESSWVWNGIRVRIRR